MKAAQFAIGCALFHVAVIAFVGTFSGSSRINLIRFFSWRDASPARRRLLVVAIAPPLLTIASALAFNVKIDTNFAIGIFPVVPLLLLTTPGLALDDRAHDWLKGIIAIFMAVMLIASPIIAAVRFAQGGERADEPRAEAARALESIWNRETGKPLAIVAGAWPYADEAPFYASGAVSHFIGLSPRLAPWIDEARLRRDGIAVICLADEAACMSETRKILPGPLSETPFAARKRFLGWEGREARFVAVIQSPRSP